MGQYTLKLSLLEKHIKGYVDPLFLQEIRALISKMETRIEELEPNKPYHVGSTNEIKKLKVGQSCYFLVDKEAHERKRKALWRMASAAEIKVSTRAISKDGKVQIKVTRLV